MPLPNRREHRLHGTGRGRIGGAIEGYVLILPHRSHSSEFTSSRTRSQECNGSGFRRSHRCCKEGRGWVCASQNPPGEHLCHLRRSRSSLSAFRCLNLHPINHPAGIGRHQEQNRSAIPTCCHIERAFRNGSGRGDRTKAQE